MNDRLTRDEFAALEEVRALAKGAKPSACIARNARHLVGLKLLQPRSGAYVLTEKGTEALFVRSCVAGLLLLSTDQNAILSAPVASFLIRKGHVVEVSPNKFAMTEKGRECLADIAQHT